MLRVGRVRVAAPGFPHHVTQRGNRRQRTFFGHDDYKAYLELMAHKPLLKMLGEWRRFHAEPTDDDIARLLARHERTGRPLGDDVLLDDLERRLDRKLRPGRPGRKPRQRGRKRSK